MADPLGPEHLTEPMTAQEQAKARSVASQGRYLMSDAGWAARQPRKSLHNAIHQLSYCLDKTLNALESTQAERDRLRDELPEIRQRLSAVEKTSRLLKNLDRPSIICLCGSTRFADVFNREAERLTLAGFIVLRPEVVTYSRDNDPQHHAPDVKARLDELHLRKIDLADIVRILNVDGYIGESTQREIDYAFGLGKQINWFEPTRAPLKYNLAVRRESRDG